LLIVNLAYFWPGVFFRMILNSLRLHISITHTRSHALHLCSRALFAKAEAVFTKALQFAPKDKVIIYSFAVCLSIKLRLLLFDTGATLQDLDKTRFAIRERERLHNLKVRGRVLRPLKMQEGRFEGLDRSALRIALLFRPHDLSISVWP
jgi:hypothetical protein